jgi:hypothetical protein
MSAKPLELQPAGGGRVVPLGEIAPPEAATPLRARVETRLGVPIAVVFVAVGAALAATIWSAATNSMLLYGDARAHLDVARHVTDGLNTGPTQLGSVWLPIPHILMVPFTAIRVLWHTGAAGAIVGGLCFVYGATRIFVLVEELSGGDRVAAWIGFVVFVANLNMLYLQSTALTEPVLLALLIGATLHLARWMRTLSVRELTWGAFFVMLATLTRYEAWAYLIAAVGVVFLWSWRRDRRRESGQANVVLFSVYAAYGIVLWLIYNATIFHDPLYFLHSKYSAQTMNGAYGQFGLLDTKHDAVESVLVYGWDLIDIIGPLVLGAAGVSILLLLVMRYPERFRTAMTLVLLGAPVAFEFVSLYVGQTTIRVPERPPHEMYNDRYGVIALPLCAVAIGLVMHRRRWLGALVAAVAAVGLVAATFGSPLTLRDGRRGISSATAGRKELAAAYLHSHYAGGRVLADDSEASKEIFAANLDLKEFVTPGFHPYWEHAITDPQSHVRWVVAAHGDAITADLLEHPDRFAGFRLVLTDNFIRLYERVR